MTKSRIKDLNNHEKPREKLVARGPEFLTDEELLGIILGSGGKGSSAITLARNILNTFGGIKSLYDATIESLTVCKYVGSSKACAIKAAVEIGIRATQPSNKTSEIITKPEDAYRAIQKVLYNLSVEKLILICLDSRYRIISQDILSVGSLAETIVSPREIYKKAFARNAASIILAHNHPSGDITPSTEDIKTTNKVGKLGKEIGIPVVDHIIVGDGRYSSMKLLNLLEGGDK